MEQDAPRKQLAAALSRIAGGDRAALQLVYRDTSAKLFGVCLRILRDRGEAEDVLQDVYMTVWRRAETFDPDRASPVTWLVAIARNRSIDRLRSNAVRLRAVEAAPLPDAAASPETHAVDSERQRVVKRALDTLPADQRVLIEQAYFLGLTQSELAERFQLPLGTVKTRIRTGMLTLREQLSQIEQ